MTFGPMQVLVVGFGGEAEFSGEIVTELRRLREHDIVGLADLLFVTKDADGVVTSMEASDLPEQQSTELRALAGALTGFGEDAGTNGPVPSDEEVRYIADAIPPGTSAAVVVLEHRWAIPLRDAIERTAGGVVADAWLQRSDIVAPG
jgi:uncharacterized membrane protein